MYAEQNALILRKIFNFTLKRISKKSHEKEFGVMGD